MSVNRRSRLPLRTEILQCCLSGPCLALSGGPVQVIIPIVKRSLKLGLLSLLFTASGCGGSASGSFRSGAGAEINSGPHLETKIEGERWYEIPTRCGQGPYEIELGSLGARYGEGVELLVNTPRRIELTAVLLLDGQEVVRNSKVFGQRSAGALESSKVDNQRCVANALDTATAVGTSVPIPIAPPVGTRPVTTTGESQTPDTGARISKVRLEVVERRELGIPGLSVVGFSWPQLPVGGHLKIQFWSKLPNDFEGVSFFLLQSAERPTVSEAEYEAFLTVLEENRQREIRIELEARTERERVARVEEEAQAEAELLRLEEVRIQADIRLEREKRERELRPRPRAKKIERRPPPTAEEIVLRRSRAETARRIDRERLHAQQEARRQAQTKLRIQMELKVKLRLEREARKEQKRRRRKAYCDAHLKDTQCWGAGGYFVSLDLERRSGERESYCKAHQNEARCWNSSEWSRRKQYFAQRVADSNAPEPEPDGPPPSPLEEFVPPRLSVNADWRPGYWHWYRGWVWIGGVWRVPESDLQQELTTQAPELPPVLKVEVRPVAPIASAVWVSGFWQWDSQAWVWVGGSWQLPPNSRVQWRPTSWSARGAVHVLVPGAWVKIGVGR